MVQILEYSDINNIVNNIDFSKRNHLTVKKQDNLYLIRYKKDKLNYTNYENLFKYRSVITDGSIVYSVAPTKSQNVNLFMKSNKFEDCIIEEFLEGTMMNCFYHNNQWKLATRSRIHADCKFSQSVDKTFKDMFFEAMTVCKLKFYDLNTKYMYTFVLQHPDNRIVVEFKKPNIALVEVKKYDGCKMEIMNIHTEEFEYLKDIVTFPKILHYYDSWQYLLKMMTYKHLHYSILGCIIKCKKTGIRAKIRNPNYEKVRYLKGNNPKIQFQYYNLRRMGKVRDYLYYFPEDKKKFEKLRYELHIWTRELTFNYSSCYIKKSVRDLKQYPFQFRIHMYNLHQIYLNELRPFGSYVSKQVVINYVNNLEPAVLMYAMNYHLRQEQALTNSS